MRSPLLVALLASGCSTSSPQVLTGRIAPGFPSPITEIKVTTSSIQSWQGDARVATVPVAADGTFRIELPALTGVQLALVAADGHNTLVFPRQTGAIDRRFAVRGNGVAFDLGAVRYVGSASSTTYAFQSSDGSCTGSDAMCVDDRDTNQDTCGQNDGQEQTGDNQDGNQDGETADDGAGQDTTDMGDAVAEHNFPADGCADDQGDHQDGNDGESNDG